MIMNQEQFVVTMPTNHLKITTQTAYGIDPTDSAEGCSNLTWLPKSQIKNWVDDPVTRISTFQVPRWIVDAKRLKERFAVDPKITIVEIKTEE